MKNKKLSLTNYLSNSYISELNISLAKFKENQINNFNSLLETICRSLEIIDEIKFIGLETEPINDLNKKSISLEDTYAIRYRCNFMINYKGEEEKISFYFDFPKLIDNYFILKGNRYIPILQLINYQPIHICSNNSYKIIIKTLINKFIITITKSKSEKARNRGNITANLFMKNINITIILLALIHFSFDTNNPLKYLLDSFFDDYDILDSTSEEEATIDLKTKKIMIRDKDLENNEYKQLIISTIKYSKIKYNDSNDRNYIFKQIGKKFTSNTSKYYEKAESVLLTFNRILDDISIKNFEIDNIYDLIVKEIKLINNPVRLDHFSITNRKLIFNEVFIYPLIKRLSDNLYIYINSNHKNMNKLKNIFKISPSIVIDYLLTSEVIHYDNTVNNFSVLMKYKTNLLPVNAITSEDMKTVNKNYIGLVDLFSTSNNKKTAGVSSYLTPLNSKYIFDLDGFIIDKNNIYSNDI